MTKTQVHPRAIGIAIAYMYATRHTHHRKRNNKASPDSSPDAHQLNTWPRQCSWNAIETSSW